MDSISEIKRVELDAVKPVGERRSFVQDKRQKEQKKRDLERDAQEAVEADQGDHVVDMKVAGISDSDEPRLLDVKV